MDGFNGECNVLVEGVVVLGYGVYWRVLVLSNNLWGAGLQYLQSMSRHTHPLNSVSIHKESRNENVDCDLHLFNNHLKYSCSNSLS